MAVRTGCGLVAEAGLTAFRVVCDGPPLADDQRDLRVTIWIAPARPIVLVSREEWDRLIARDEVDARDDPTR